MTLEAWVQEATANIELHAAQRICHEYQDHLEDALAAGTTEDAFVADLGNAKTANTGFMRAYLTLSDVALLDSPRGPLHPRWLWLFSLLSVCSVGLALAIAPLRSLLVAVLMLAGLGFWFWLRAAQRSGRLSSRQAGQMCWDAATVISGLSMALASGQLAWLLCSFTILTGVGIPRWRKLRLDAQRVM